MRRMMLRRGLTALLVLPIFPALITGCTPGTASSVGSSKEVASTESFAGHSSGEALPEQRYKLDPNLPHAFSNNKARKVKMDEIAPDFAMKTVDGKALKLSDFKGKTTLFMFVDTSCPCVLAYNKRVKELNDKFGEYGLRTVFVFSNGKTDTSQEVAQFVKAQKYTWPCVLDLDQKLMKQFNAACSTETFLFDGKGRLRYHGRVDDDTFEPKAVRERDLQSAIVAVVGGRAVPVRETRAFGCAIPTL